MALDNEPITERISPLGRILVVCATALMFALGGLATTGFVSTVLFVVALALFALGSYRMVTAPEPPERFEVGSYRADHEYRGVTITAVAEVWYAGPRDEEIEKFRAVEVAALTEDGTAIVRESDTETVGSKLDRFGLVGGDFDSARSTSDHILAVATPVHEYLDEWLAAEGNDLAVKAALETEFEDMGPERETSDG